MIAAPLVAHRLPSLVVAVILISSATTPDLATPTPVPDTPIDGALLVKPTTAAATTMAATWDGTHGAIVLWQEERSAGRGVLFAQHVLRSGEVDHGWPAEGAVVCSTEAARRALGIVNDGVGGAYCWWVEDRDIYVSRLEPGGTIAASWPERGKLLAPRLFYYRVPTVLPDGLGGIYVCWQDHHLGIDVLRLGPHGQPVAGWSSGPRLLNSTLLGTESALAPSFHVGDNGGFWAVWGAIQGSWEAPAGGSFRVQYRNARGLPEAGWDHEGATVGEISALDSYNLGVLLESPYPLAAVAPNPLGAVDMVRWDPLASDPTWPDRLRLRRYTHRLESGEGWPAEGVPLAVVWPYGRNMPTGAPLRLQRGPGPDLQVIAPGVLAGMVRSIRDGSDVTQPLHSSVVRFGWPRQGEVHHAEVTGDGDRLLHSNATTTWYDGHHGGLASVEAALVSARSGESAFIGESRGFSSASSPGPYGRWERWYGSSTVVSTHDGSAMLFWCQVNEVQGILARPLGPLGDIVSVPGSSWVPDEKVSARFDRPVGVRVRLGTDVVGPVRISLMDVNGRRIASLGLTADHGGDWLVPGTREIPPGLYFVVARSTGDAASVKVVVAR
jgi:hypothetical protein